MFVKIKKWFGNIFREYVLVFSKIRENKISIKEGVSLLLTKYSEFSKNIRYSNPKNDYFTPILNEKLKSSIENGKPLRIATFKMELFAKVQHLCIELYQQGIETYISRTLKSKIIFNPDDFTKIDLEKEKKIILDTIAKEDAEYAIKVKAIAEKKRIKEAKKALNHIMVDTKDIEPNEETFEEVEIVEEPKFEVFHQTKQEEIKQPESLIDENILDLSFEIPTDYDVNEDDSELDLQSSTIEQQENNSNDFWTVEDSKDLSEVEKSKEVVEETVVDEQKKSIDEEDDLLEEFEFDSSIKNMSLDDDFILLNNEDTLITSTVEDKTIFNQPEPETKVETNTEILENSSNNDEIQDNDDLVQEIKNKDLEYETTLNSQESYFDSNSSNELEEQENKSFNFDDEDIPSINNTYEHLINQQKGH